MLHGAPAIAVAVDRDVVARRSGRRGDELAVRRARARRRTQAQERRRARSADVARRLVGALRRRREARARLVGRGHRRRRRAGARQGRAHARRRAPSSPSPTPRTPRRRARAAPASTSPAASTAAPFASCARTATSTCARSTCPTACALTFVWAGQPRVDGRADRARQGARRVVAVAARGGHRAASCRTRTRSPAPSRPTIATRSCAPPTPTAQAMAALGDAAGCEIVTRRARAARRARAPSRRRGQAVGRRRRRPRRRLHRRQRRHRRSCAKTFARPASPCFRVGAPAPGLRLENRMTRSSRIPGFYKLSLAERRAKLAERIGIDAGARWSRRRSTKRPPTTWSRTWSASTGCRSASALNFRVNGTRLPGADGVEEPSVIAAASNAAKMVREGGGFIAEADDPIMIAQVQLDRRARHASPPTRRIEAHAAELLAHGRRRLPVAGRARRRRARHRGAHARALDRARAGHAVRARLRRLPRRDGRQPGQHHRRGGRRSPRPSSPTPTSGLRILSNLADRRCVRVTCARAGRAASPPTATSGEAVRDGIVAASRFAELDPYRAATHNKGIMNGVDAVVIATGNDWRGVEAGAHAFAAARARTAATARSRPGASPTTARAISSAASRCRWRVGTVGGTLRVHPGARLALKLLGVERASRRSAWSMACAGPGVEPGGAARAGHRRHPARAHGAARALAGAARRRHRRAGRSRGRGDVAPRRRARRSGAANPGTPAWRQRPRRR